MGGWRDEDGRTAADRKKIKGEGDRARFASNARHRPLSLLKGLAVFVFVVVLVVALVSSLR